MNALYFNGDWTYGFNEEQVEEKPFFNVDGTTKDISFMSLTKRLNYFENDSFQAVSLPYGEGEVSMNVFLPKEGRSIHDLQQLLTNENWNMWKSEFKEQDGTIILPKFQFEYGIDLKDVLIALGMNRAFSNEAQFTNMVNESGIIKISKVKQKTFIDVNEKGTEAAAVTSVEIVVESAVVDHQPFHMEVNRPFFFTITHNETGVNLFLGLISHLGED